MHYQERIVLLDCPNDGTVGKNDVRQYLSRSKSNIRYILIEMIDPFCIPIIK